MGSGTNEKDLTGLGDSVPEPLGFIAFAPEWFYTEGTCTEDRAPQGLRPERRCKGRNGTEAAQPAASNLSQDPAEH